MLVLGSRRKLEVVHVQGVIERVEFGKAMSKICTSQRLVASRVMGQNGPPSAKVKGNLALSQIPRLGVRMLAPDA